MILTTLIENLVYQKGLIAEHGLSFYLDTSKSKILFDTGQGVNYIHNARQLGVDIAAIDYLIISHGHFDHSGGIQQFLKENKKARIILKKQALNRKFSGDYEIGMGNIESLPNNRMEFIDKPREINPNITLVPFTKCFFPEDSHKKGFLTEKEGIKIADPFDDELFLYFRQNDKQYILSSCSHNGITNIIETARNHFNLPVSHVIGGFHLMKATRSEVEHIATYLNNSGIESVGVCHCTGIDAYNFLKQNCTCNIYYNSTGTIINIT
jgi:7,8-dihydropterin-6-yl-methyl-4-(beta-D-ribofuranosyl)aminobenzene 5'-phosphate synthase